jgi:hypothetical protein
MTATAFSARRELAHRTSDGIEVTMFWSRPSDRITIAVFDTRSDEALEFEVDGSGALDAFNHPYAYAAALHARECAVSRLDAETLTASTDR